MSVATSGMEKSGGGSSEGRLKNAVLIAGPTASGKSALALEIAERRGGAIVNTDSMQGYSILNVLTARPTGEEMARAPHHLYGHIHPGTAYSTGAWLRDVMRLMAEDAFKDRIPVFVGGTGLYFRALVEGISEMPEIPKSVRDRWRYHLNEDGPERLHRITAVAMTGVDEILQFPSSRALGYDVGFPGPLDSPTLFGMAGSGGTAAYADTATGVAVAVTKNRVTYGEFNAFNQVGDIVTKALDGR